MDLNEETIFDLESTKVMFQNIEHESLEESDTKRVAANI